MINAVDRGSLITVVWGVKTLAHVAVADKTYHSRLFPILLTQLQTCIPRDVPMHAESMLVAVSKADSASFLTELEKRKPELKGSQLARLNKVVKKVQRL